MILLTGASGYVGRHLAAELRSRGLELRALVRNEGRGAPLLELGAEVAVGDVGRPASLNLACEEIDTVIHLVGLLREGWRTTFDQVVVEGSRNLIAACKERGVKRLVYVSALGAHEDATSRYFATKGLVEALVRDSELTYQIWRPSLMLGRGEKLTEDLSRLLRVSPLLPRIQLTGEGKLQPLMVGDAVEIMADLLTSDEAWGSTFDIAGPEPLTLAEIADHIATAMGRRPLRFPVPAGPLKMVTRLLNPIAPLLPLSADQLKMLTSDGTAHDNRYTRYSHVVPRPVDQGLAELFAKEK